MEEMFVYGTLIFPEVVQALTGRSFPCKRVSLDGYKRYRIYDGEIPREYPAIIQSPGDRVDGLVLSGIDPESFALFDYFEEEEYRRIRQHCDCEGDSRLVYAYVWNPDSRVLLQGEWDPEVFRQHYLQVYLDTVIPELRRSFNSEFMHDYNSGENR